ncbi:MAG TPA: alpha/beta fold hydrolase [Mycobacteriales bacterium]|nr:alpha/beta fold hydrolase [Mycobacteriales bacterium]
MTVMPGAEPFRADGGPHGVVMCHGFTGTPQSMRPWAEYLAAAGCTVSLPRLPGHGTRWQDLQTTAWTDWYQEVEQAFGDVRARCDTVFVCGLSMGGALALRLAQRHPDGVAGLVLVNPAIHSYRRDLALLPVLSRVVASRPGIGSDIRKPGTVELAYPRTPLRAAHEMTRLWKVVRADLGLVRAPTLLYRSRVDHVVDTRSGSLIRLGVREAPVRERVLENSFHVATLDHDAPGIFEGSLGWMREVPGPRRNTPPPLVSDGTERLPSSSGESVQSTEPAG